MPASQRLNEQFNFDARTRIYDQLNRLLLAIEGRIAGLEAIKAELGVAVDNITEVALTRLNDIFTPMIVDAQKRLEEFGANFSAQSVTPLTIGLGGKVLSIVPDDKEGYVFADYVAIRHRNGSEFMIAIVDSYDRPNGQLYCTVVDTTGTGTFADWDIRIAVPPDLSHASRTDNPHHVTAAQVGAYTVQQTDDRIYALNDVQSNVLTSTVQAQINLHSTRSDNPHGVTALQVGAYTKAESDARDNLRVLKSGDSITGNLYVDGNIRAGTGAAVFGNARLLATSYAEVSDGLRSTLIGADPSGGFIGTFSNHPFVLRQNNLNRLTLNTDGTIQTSGSLTAGGNVQGQDLYSIRAGSPTTGVLFLGNSGSKYLHFDGTNYSMPGATLSVAGISTGAITASGALSVSGSITCSGSIILNGGNVSVNSTAGYLLQTAAGAHYIRSASSINIADDNGVMTSIGGSLTVGGNIQCNTGINANGGISLAGQFTANGYSYIRGATLGYGGETVTSAGTHNINGNTTIGGSIQDNGNLTVNGSTSLRGTTLGAGGEGCTFGGAVQCNSSFNINGQYTTGGYSYLRGLTIGWGGEAVQSNGPVTFGSNLTVNGSTSLRGSNLGAGGETTTVSGHLQANSNQQTVGYLEVLGPIYARGGFAAGLPAPPDVGNPVINSRLAYAGDENLFQTGSAYERWGGAVLTGGIWNPQWTQPLFRWRYMQIQMRDGNWYTIGYV